MQYGKLFFKFIHFELKAEEITSISSASVKWKCIEFIECNLALIQFLLKVLINTVFKYKHYSLIEDMDLQFVTIVLTTKQRIRVSIRSCMGTFQIHAKFE